MRIIDWQEWLDSHIPYYERQRQEARFLDNPPAVVVQLSVIDRYDKHRSRNSIWFNWDTANNEIQDLGYKNSPLFLDTDTHQQWFWAFWDRDEALLVLLKLQ